MTTRTITHIAIGPDENGKRAEPCELHAMLAQYMDASRDPEGAMTATQDRISLTTHQVEITTAQELREHQLISLVLRLFQTEIDVSASFEDIVESIGSTQDLIYLSELVRRFREDGFAVPYTLEAKD